MPKSKRILWLSLAVNGVEEPYSELIEYAAQHRISIQTIQQHPPITAMQFVELLEQADGFFLTFYDLLDREEFRTHIISEIKKGKRLLVLGRHIEFNSLLLEFGLGIKRDRFCGPKPLFGDERTVLVRHEDQTNVSARVLLGGKVVTVSQPSQIWYQAPAKPVFSVPRDSTILSKDDIFEAIDHRDLCCGGLWAGEADNRAGLLVLAGSVISDPMLGFTGKPLPGIRANIPFLEALLDWWVGGIAIEHYVNDASAMLRAIEYGLYDVVMTVLKKNFDSCPDDWWDRGVPESLQKKIEEHHKESKNPAKKEHGFYLIDYKTIIERNWSIFAEHFDSDNQGRKKALGWIQKLNGLRNRVNHPTRLREQPLTADEHSEIEHRKNFVESLCRSFLSGK